MRKLFLFIIITLLILLALLIAYAIGFIYILGASAGFVFNVLIIFMLGYGWTVGHIEDILKK